MTDHEPAAASRLPRSLIFVWNNPPLIEGCLNLAKSLLQCGRVPVLVTLDERHDELIAEAGLRHEALYSVMAEVGEEAVKRVGELSRGNSGFILHGIDIASACAYERLALQRGFPAFETSSEPQLLAKTALCIEAWAHLLGKYQPTSCFVWNGLALPSLGLKWLCAERGIVCASLERGLLPDMLVVDPVGINYGGALGGDRWREFDAELPEPDLIKAAAYIQEYRLRGRSVLNHGEELTAAELKDRLNIPERARIVLLPLQLDFDTNILYFSPRYPTNVSVVEELVAAVKSLGGWHIVVKAHPENPGEDLDRIARLLDGWGVVVTQVALPSLLNAADAVVVRNSTVGLEAALFGRPVIALGNSAWSGKGFTIDAGERGRLAGLLGQSVNGADDKQDANEGLKRFVARLTDGYHFRLAGGADADRRNRRLLRRILASPPPSAWQRQPQICISEEQASYAAGELPMVSVIISTHNRAALIGRAIASVLSQDYPNFEVIVVDDGSTDDTSDVVSAIKDERLRYISKPPTGAPDTINRGVAEARGEFVLQLDDDDELLPGALAMYGDLARRRSDIDVFFGELEYVEDGRRTREPKYQPYDGRVPLRNVLLGCPLPHGGTLIRRSAFEKCGRFNVDFKRAYDYEWWSRSLPQLRVLHSGSFVYRWHIHDASLTAFTAKDFSKVDTTYEAKIVRGMLSRHSYQELFPEFDWKGAKRRSTAQAMTLTAGAFWQWRAREDALSLLERSRRLYPLAQTYHLLALAAEGDADLPSALMFARCALSAAPLEPALNAEYSRLCELWATAAAKRSAHPRPQGSRYVNVTIVTHNRLEFTKRCIEALNRNTLFPHVVTVVDNGSEDGTPAFLKQLHTDGVIHNLILHPSNRGVAAAANDGWEAEDCDYYLKLDNDIVIEKPGWLAALVELVDRAPEVGTAGYNFEPASFPLAMMGGMAVRVKPAGGTLGGCCILVPRRVHDKLGFWAEVFGLYGEEDRDFGARAQLAGFANVYMPDEQIGLHLPDGRAAVIDEQFNIHSSEESEYRRFKEKCRREAEQLRLRRFTAMERGELSLFQSRGSPSEAGKLGGADLLQAIEHSRGNNLKREAFSQESTDTECLKVAVYSPDPPFFACPYIRIWSPLASQRDIQPVSACEYHTNGYRIRSAYIDEADAVIFQRNIIQAREITEAMLATAERRNIPVIFEIDDDLMNLTPDHPSWRILKDFHTDVERFAGRFDAITVSTEYLAQMMQPYGAPVYVVPNLVDGHIWTPPVGLKPREKLVVGYMGTPTHRHDLAHVVKAIKELMKKHPEEAEVWLWGGIHPDLIGVPGVKLVAPLKPNYLEFVAEFSQHRPDIALAPLHDVPFNWAKSSIKFLEYSSLRIPGIYSNVGPYSGAVRHLETGMLVENTTSAWLEAMETLISDVALRERLGAAARLEVMRYHSIARQGGAMAEVIRKSVQLKRQGTLQSAAVETVRG